MKKNRGKLVFILITVLVSLYFLYPTYKDYQLSKEARSLTGDDSTKFVESHDKEIRDAKAKRIKLGLDLQGGMRVVLEVNVLKFLDELAKNKDDQFHQIFAEVSEEAKASELDLVDLLKVKFEAKQVRMSRYYGLIRDTDDEVVTKLKTESTTAIDRSVEIVRNRVDQYGVSEPSIQKQGNRRVIVELPGVSKEAEVRQLLQGTALLEFKLVIDPEIASKVYQSIDRTLAGKPLEDTSKADTAKTDTTGNMASNDTTGDQNLTEEQAKKQHPFFYLAGTSSQQQNWSGELFSAEENKAKVMAILTRPDIQRLIPSDMGFVWSAKPGITAEGKKFFTLIPVKKTAELTGGVITNAKSTIDPVYNSPIVEMTMNDEGAKNWARITGSNIGKHVAVIMDNACYSFPRVQEKIPGGQSRITGMENIEEANLLSIVLRAGALPAPVDIIQQTSVGPSLGEDSIRQGVLSSLLALGLTILFMIFYYKTGGTMADIALLLNTLFVLGVLAAFQGTLTLPGIAGLILTIAIAVDANVLIYERIREESVTGKSLTAAIDAGYTRAFTVIFDSHLTAIISGIILYQFGSGPVQGFALTLMIGLISSIYSSVIISRVIIDILTERGTHVSFG
ncbi:MAG TPA: protein translocase subunit SecD [Bacteroidota bacterium]|nr:protein translocase subunit SecD [Bacteroidota bacterium]